VAGRWIDDAELGDSLPELGDKADGYGVPQSLGLDKRGIVYLTFDDGPSPLYTAPILDVLARHGVKATFFVTGANIAGNEALLRRERDEGHIVANHQWSHVVATEAQFESWVRRERDLLKSVVGVMPQYFRYPFGAMKAWKETILAQLGYADGGVGWDIDSLDWDFGPDARASRPEVPAAFKRDFEGWVLEQARRRGGGVMLFHDVQSITATRLDGIITKLKQRGFRFGELPRRPGATPAPRAGFIGDACTTDGDCSFDEGFCLKDGHPGGVCTRACTTSCPDRAGHATTRCVRAPDGLGAQIDVCALSCEGAQSSCRSGLSCSSLASPSGTARKACW
jgi:peptidoglycan/xylan/chitin deacetylase (PgdA/CDA1 family)